MSLEQCKEDVNTMIDDYQRILDIAASLPAELHDDITFMSASYLYFKDMTYDEHLEYLRKLKKYDPEIELGNYFMSYKDLVIDYRMKGIGIWFTITDSEEGVRRVSDGKCNIIDKEMKSYTTKTIICGEQL